MHSFARSLAFALALSLSTASFAEIPTATQEIEGAPSAGAMAFDLVLVRPVSLVATVLGTGLFVVSLPFTALAGDVKSPAERLVMEPARYTFTRPLGESD
jgi:hypothetical protein